MMAASTERKIRANGAPASTIVHLWLVLSCIQIATGAPGAPGNGVAINLEWCDERIISNFNSLALRIPADLDDIINSISDGKDGSKLEYPAEGCQMVLDKMRSHQDKMESFPEMAICKELYLDDLSAQVSLQKRLSENPEFIRASLAFGACTVYSPLEISARSCVEQSIWVSSALYWSIRDDLKDFVKNIMAGRDASDLEYPAESCKQLKDEWREAKEKLYPARPDMREKCDELYESSETEKAEFERFENRSLSWVRVRFALDVCDKHGSVVDN